MTIAWLGHTLHHCNDVIMSMMASQITSLKIVYSTVCSGADQRKHQSSASLASVRGIHWWPFNSLHKGPSNVENVSIWWRHHDRTAPLCREYISYQWIPSGGFSTQKANNAKFSCFFTGSLDKCLNKQSSGLWSQTPSRPCDNNQM